MAASLLAAWLAAPSLVLGILAGPADGGTITLKGRTLIAEVARTERERARALIFRTVFKAERCLFAIPPEAGLHPVRPSKFLLPFDVVWIDAGGLVVEILEHMPPCPEGAGCPSHGGTRLSHYHLFLAAGMVKRLALRAGDRIQWDIRFADGSRFRTGGRLSPGNEASNEADRDEADGEEP